MESRAIMFLACWLEYHSDIPAAVVFVERIYAERVQRGREFFRRWTKRWYGEKINELCLRPSPVMERIRREQEGQ